MAFLYPPVSACRSSDHVLFGAAPLLVTDDNDASFVKAGEPGDDRCVVGKTAIAVQFDPVGEKPLHVVERVGAVRMPRDHDLLHRGQIGEDLARQPARFFFETLELRFELGVARGEVTKLPNALDQVDDRFLEGEDERCHGGIPHPKRA
jgi:hypothetical protein